MKKGDSRSRYPSSLFYFSAVALSVLMAVTAVDAVSDEPSFEGSGGYRTFKSDDGRYAIISNNGPEAVGLSRWVAEVVARLERNLGRSLPYSRSNYFQLVIHIEQQSTLNGPSIDTSEWEILDRKIDTIVVNDYFNIEREHLMAELCRMLMNSSVKKESSKKPEHNPHSFPDWLVVGVSQNLFSADRGRNGREIQKRWRSGAVVPIENILSGRETKPDSATSWALAGWILSFSEEIDIVDRIYERVSEGELITSPWLASQLFPRMENVDVGAKWDYWIFAQKNRVYDLGRLDSDLMHELGSELLIYRGTYGISWNNEWGNSLSIDQLIKLKDEPWMSGLCAEKSADIRMLGFGKAKEFSELTGRYCNFFDALGKSASNWKLKGLLKKAGSDYAKLEERVGNGKKTNN